MKAHFLAAVTISLLSLVGTSFARSFASSNINIQSPGVYYVGKFCFNPVQSARITVSAQGSASTYFVLMDDQPPAWPAATASTGFARAGNKISGSDDPSVCQKFLSGDSNEFNSTLPVITSVTIQENFRRNWYFAFVNCQPSDAISVASYSFTMSQGDGGSGSPLSCDQTGKYELFATYFSFFLIALLALLAFARKLGIPMFSPSSPHALLLYAIIIFTIGLAFMLAEADAQRASGDLVPHPRQSLGMFLLQVADWLMLAQAFSVCTGISSLDHFKHETLVFKIVFAAFCLTYFILSIITIATDAQMYDQSDYTDSQPVNSSGIGISVLRLLLLLFFAYTAHKSYRATIALENKSFLKIFYSATLSWQLIIVICVLASINTNPFSLMISIWASTLTFNFLYLASVCYLLMQRWTDVPVGSAASQGRKQPFIDDDAASPSAGSAATDYRASI